MSRAAVFDLMHGTVDPSNLYLTGLMDENHGAYAFS